MDYILMPDSTVKVMEAGHTIEAAMYALNTLGGVALYWQAFPFGWSFITHGHSPGNDPTDIEDEDVPDVIKLAAMLR